MRGQDLSHEGIDRRSAADPDGVLRDLADLLSKTERLPPGKEMAELAQDLRRVVGKLAGDSRS